jgi:hypothetical protein
VRGGKVTCRGKVGSRNVAGRPGRRGGRATCSFAVPATAAGKTFRGRVRLDSQGYYAFTELSGRVVGTRRLVVTSLGTNIKTPLAGQVFQASFGVELKRAGSPTRRISRGSVTCQATVNGVLLRPRKARFVSEFLAAQCEWLIPSSARGSTLRGRVIVGAAGLTASKSFSYPIR